jgi:carbon monoxide dehydrogenase subunit G
LGTNIVTLTVTDVNGNVSTCQSTVTVEDNLVPVPDLVTLEDVTAECEVPVLVAPTATDNCSVTITNDATLPITGEGTTTVVTWTYDDGNGNTTTQTQSVIIDDVTAPTPDVVALADVTAECEVTSLVAPTGTDNCTNATVSVTNDATLPITGEGTTTVVTWTYDDGNGNTFTQTQNVIIDDVTPPVLVNCPTDITQVNDLGDCSAVVNFTPPTFTDNCSTTQEPAGFTSLGTLGDKNYFISGTPQTAVAAFTDAAANGYNIVTITSQQLNSYLFNQLIAQGITSAALLGYNDVTTEGSFVWQSGSTATYTNWGAGEPNNGAIGGEDYTVFATNGIWNDTNENSIVRYIIEIEPFGAQQTAGLGSGSIFPVGTTTNTFTATDAAGNITTCSFDVVVTDAEAPVANATTLADILADCELTSLTAPTATDNCAATVTATNNVTLPITTQGTTVVTWIYDDGNGNTSTQTQNVLIEDVLQPVADAASLRDLVFNCEVAALTAPTATDNCAGTVTGTATFPITSTTVVEWIFDDGNGNVSTQDQTIIIEQRAIDAIPAVVICDSFTLPAITGNFLTGNQMYYTEAGGTGLAFAEATTLNFADFTSYPVTLYAYDTDVVGCSDEVSFTLTINETPVITAITDVTACDQYTLPVLMVGNYYTFPAGNGTLLVAGTTINATQTLFVYAIDVSGNCTDEDSFEVTITPLEDASFNYDMTTYCPNGMDPTPSITGLSGGNFTASAGLVIDGVTGVIDLDGSALGSYVITYTTNGGCPQSTTASITIEDTAAPSPDVIALTDLVFNCEVGSLTAPTATDNCAGTIVGTTTIVFPITSTATVTWTYDDGNGNQSVQNLLVIIESTSVDAIANAVQCDSFTLPAITGDFLTGNQMYYTQSGGAGLAFAEATTINFADFASYPVTLYAYDTDAAGCSSETSFQVTLTQTPVIGTIADVTICDAYTLPTLAVGNYYTFPGGTGTLINAGTVLTDTQTLFVYAQDVSGACTDEESLVVTITETDIAGATLANESFTYDGTTQSLTVGNIPASATVVYTNNDQVDAGTYQVTATISSSIASCNPVVLTATMTIDRAPQTITFETLLRRWLNVDPDFQLTASSSSGLPVVYDFSFTGASPAATVSTTGFVSLLEEGEILIQASQAGNANYLPATSVLQTLEVYLENDTSLNVIVIDGNSFTNPGDETYYLIECNDDKDSVNVTIENDTRATFDPGASFTIATPMPGIYTQQVVVTADNGRDTRVYTIVVERRFDFDAIVEQKFNNTLVVNNNFDNNGGYEFVAYQWFKNGNMVSTRQSFSEGDNASDLLDPTAAYYVKMTTVQGDVLQTCISTVELGATFSLSVLENPVSFGRNLNLRADFPLAELEGAMYQIYTSAGRLIKTLPVQGFDSSVSLSPSLPVGLYRVVLATSQRTASVNFIKN